MITDKQLKSKISTINDPSFFCLNVLLDQIISILHIQFITY